MALRQQSSGVFGRGWDASIGALVMSLAGLVGCKEVPPPRLADALTTPGGTRARALALLQVGTSGIQAERARAWFVAGLLDCELGSPTAAITAFRQASPHHGRAALAARRLEEALVATASDTPIWLAAAASPWLEPTAASRLGTRCAEVASGRGRWDAMERCLPTLDGLGADDLRRALVALARHPGPSGEAARLHLLLHFPTAATGLGMPVEELSRTLTPAQLAEQAQGWLAANRPAEALQSGRRAGRAGSLVAGRAAIKLRRATEALGLLQGSSAEVWVEWADAYRLVGWAAAPGQHVRPFAEALRAAEQALKLPAMEPGTLARAHLLAAEALTELGRFGDALPHLRTAGVTTLPRFDWVQRRWHFLQARKGQLALLASAAPGGSTRVQRLGAHWRAVGRANGGDTADLRKLVASGLPDLPAQWASQRLGIPGVPFAFTVSPLQAARPPAWADDLLTIGRVADVTLAWRADLETGRAPESEWLGLVALAHPAPLDAIPLLVKGEPRLLSGPWDGLPTALMEQYLPLPWRQEVESAAQRSGMPPWVLAGLVRQESAWNPRARSGANALGLAQILPDVGRETGARLGLRVRTPADLFEPATNLTIGARLLADWRRSFGGAWEPALASYNAGERRMRMTWNATGQRPGPLFVEAIELPETHDYVHRVVLLAEGYRALYWPEGKPYPWT